MPLTSTIATRTAGVTGVPSGLDDAPLSRKDGTLGVAFLRVLDRAPSPASPTVTGAVAPSRAEEPSATRRTTSSERPRDADSADASGADEGPSRRRAACATAQPLRDAWARAAERARADALRAAFPEIDPDAVAFDLVARYDDPLAAIDDLRQWFAVGNALPGALLGAPHEPSPGDAGAWQAWWLQLGAEAVENPEGLGASWLMRTGRALAALDPHAAGTGLAGGRPSGVLAALLDPSIGRDAGALRGVDLDGGRLARWPIDAMALAGAGGLVAFGAGATPARSPAAPSPLGGLPGAAAAGEGAARILDVSRLLGAPDALGRVGVDPGLARGLVERMRWLVGSGGGLAELRLHPPQLGSVDLRVHVEGERVHVQFLASQAVTRDLLETHLPRLREALEAGGLTLGEASVGQRDAGGDAEHAEGSPGRDPGGRADQSQRVSSEATDTGHADEHGARQTTLERLAARLDVYV